MLISDCPDVTFAFSSILFTLYLFSIVLFACDWFARFSFFLRMYYSLLRLLFCRILISRRYCALSLLSYVFCLINSIIFFLSSVFSFIILSREFLSVVASYISYQQFFGRNCIKVTFFFFDFFTPSPKFFWCFLFGLIRPEEISSIVITVSFRHVEFGE